MLRTIFPYLILLITILLYLLFRYRKLGPVIHKVNRIYFSRYNYDSYFLILIMGIASYFLAHYQFSLIENTPLQEEIDVLSVILFYIVLLIVVVMREVEKPAIREKGISTSRGFWLWEEISSFTWSKNILRINLVRSGKKRSELWLISPIAKKEVNAYLSKMVKGKNKQKNKNIIQ